MSPRPLDVVAPDAQAFAAAHERGEAQLVWTRLVDDLETPVSAFLKLGAGRRYAGLFESVEGGAWRGRYSVVVRDPDLVWRARGEAAEEARGAEAVAAGAFAPAPGAPDAVLRRLVDESAFAPPPGLPPMVAGLFGVLGYDAVRWLEPTLGPANPDPLDLPDAVMMRPLLVAVFDSVHGEIVLATPARPQPGEDAASAYAAACARLSQARRELAAPLPAAHAPSAPATGAAELRSPTTRAAYTAMVERARDYIAAGDIFQVVPSQRFSGPFAGQPFAFYRALRRLNPSPFLYFLDLGGFQLAGSSPEILVRYRDDR
ncbi:MAG: chorismate-binding protein, partial [Caulobacteraceae bacterium]|nr:chorismate-binding protein [Caulobacter sp.]